MITAKAPNGAEIWGVLEIVPGRASIEFTNMNGEFEYTGYTSMFWEDQRPSDDNRTIFLDEHGLPWDLSDLKITKE